MKVTQHIENSKGETLFSFEVLPPLKGHKIEDIFATIDPLTEFNPKFINVTYHREEFLYKKKENNLLEKVSIRKRPGTVGISVAIKMKYKIDPVPHLICGGFTKEETENALIDLQFLGIDNVLALRGDPVKTENRFRPTPGGHSYAVELIEQINDMNKGDFLHDEKYTNSNTNFCIGAAAYPEKHVEALNLKNDIARLKAKVEAGAEFLVTQLFYDNQKYFDFVSQCRAAGIDVPIIPGIKPLTKLRHISFIPKTFFVDFPDELADQLNNCKTDADVKKVGTAWCIKQSQELIEQNVPCLHYYTMSNSKEILDVAKEVF